MKDPYKNTLRLEKEAYLSPGYLYPASKFVSLSSIPSHGTYPAWPWLAARPCRRLKGSLIARYYRAGFANLKGMPSPGRLTVFRRYGLILFSSYESHQEAVGSAHCPPTSAALSCFLSLLNRRTVGRSYHLGRARRRSLDGDRWGRGSGIPTAWMKMYIHVTSSLSCIMW